MFGAELYSHQRSSLFVHLSTIVGHRRLNVLLSWKPFSLSQWSCGRKRDWRGVRRRGANSPLHGGRCAADLKAKGGAGGS